MFRRIIYSLLFLLFTGGLLAQGRPDSAVQVIDSSLRNDSLTVSSDTISNGLADSLLVVVPVKMNYRNDPSLQWKILNRHPWLGFNGPLAPGEKAAIRKAEGKEWLFYYLVFLVLVFAVLKRAFPKYFGDLFRLFFRTTLKQRQIREQLMQTPLPSVLLNGFYVLSTGLYICFLFSYFKSDPTGSFWTLYLYICAGLSTIYFVKFVMLKFSGWLFNLSEAANAYVFVVFIINKMIGIFLLPFLLMLAFSGGAIYTVSMTLTWCLTGGLLVYRFILAYGALHNQIKVNIFHFLLYLLAFEVVPVLLIYKSLMSYFL